MILDSIPLDHPKVLEIRALIPPQWQGQAWIAGSAAARFTQAYAAGGDIDVWIAGDVGGRAERDLRRHFVVAVPDTEQDEYDHISTLVYSRDRIQILVSALDMQAVVDGFDISCHAAAIYLLGGDVIQHAEASPLVNVLTWREPRRTLMRAMKFALRYDDKEAWEREKFLECASLALNRRLLTHEQAAGMVPDGM